MGDRTTADPVKRALPQCLNTYIISAIHVLLELALTDVAYLINKSDNCIFSQPFLIFLSPTREAKSWLSISLSFYKTNTTYHGIEYLAAVQNTSKTHTLTLTFISLFESTCIHNDLVILVLAYS